MPAANDLKLITAILATADTFLREGSRLFKPLGLTVAQYNVLNILAVNAAATGLSQRELSDRLVVDRSNVTGLLDRMVKAGWVRREDDAADRRIYRIRLTSGGRRLWEKARPSYLAVIAEVTRGVTKRQASDTLVVLTRLKNGATHWQLRNGSGSTYLKI